MALEGLGRLQGETVRKKKRMQTADTIQDPDIDGLVERIKKGDGEAFMTVTRHYQRKVFLLAYSYLRDKEDALDVVQETFLRLHVKAHMFSQGRNFQNWLLQMAKNICIDSYRKRRRRNDELRSDRSIDEVGPADGQGGHDDPSSDLREIFPRCLEKLSPKQRMIFVMKHYNHLRYREIAQILDIAVGTVKSLHFKAVRNLRALMSPYIGRIG
jgi:RNA polymerase sigma-70 factor (ECF subfamily)